MNPLNVRIENLPALRVISAHGFGPQPESLAAEKMEAFLQKKGLLKDYGGAIPHYGFNNPNPSTGSPNYGYEIWAVVPPEIGPEGDLREVMFTGGLYAVTRFEDLENIGRTWEALARWREDSPYLHADHQWLEHLLNPLERDPSKYVFELYLPIKE
jgi:DNA gyrase inhibitor GyrI